MITIRNLLAYSITLTIFVAIDLVWLGAVAKGFYRRHIGHLLSSEITWSAALLFYLVFVAGMVFFAVKPALEAGSALRALTHGALFGFFAYATYDLTNQATMREWPVIVTLVDLIWGSILSGSVAYLGYHVSSRVL